MPKDACFASGDTRPAYHQLTADSRLTVAALLAQMDPKRPVARDFNAWSARALEQALLQQGYRRTLHRPADGRSRFERVIHGQLTVVVDVIGPRALPYRHGASIVGPALRTAIRDHEIVYLNGHAFAGKLKPLKHAQVLPADAYRILLLDTCWSQQHYGVAVVKARPGYDVISNTERSVTGSVDSFIELLDRLVYAAGNYRTWTWASLLAPMNELARQRAFGRVLHDFRTPFPRAEHYGLSAVCAQPTRARVTARP